MRGFFTSFSTGLATSVTGVGVVAIAYGIFWLRTGGPNGWLAIALGVAAIVFATVFGASKTWRASSKERAAQGPYDQPAASPRYDQYMRMVDPHRERPRDY